MTKAVGKYMVATAMMCCSCGRLQMRIEHAFATARDHVWPIFDADIPDTRFNKKRFREFLQVPLTPDVHQIYCHDDRMGIDSKFQIAFRCSAATISTIRMVHKMHKDTTTWDCFDQFSTKFHWWQPSAFCPVKPWVYSSEDNRYFQYLWYDSSTNRAWYLDFDL